MGETQQNHYINYPYGHNPHPNPLPRRGNKFAFTLAEVLITLVIIGVIAAITVPSLINKTNNQEYVSRLKKAYSTLAQATNLIIAEEGTPNASKGGWANSNKNILELYKKHLINSKECENGTNCWYSGGVKNLDGLETATTDDTNYPKLILSDGTLITFRDFSNNCTGGSSWATIGIYNYCAWILVDINGVKKPNKWGRDNFQFFITEKNGLKPRGCSNDSTSLSCEDNGTGHGCACKVLREGTMNY